jgi:hypothetical protein
MTAPARALLQLIVHGVALDDVIAAKSAIRL